MSQLAGKFAGIPCVSVNEDNCESITNSLKNISKNLKLILEKLFIEDYKESHHMVELRLKGNDRPAIIREISKTVTDLALNLEKINSECTLSLMSGDVLFQASASFKIPQSVNIDLLQHALESVADDLIVDIK